MMTFDFYTDTTTDFTALDLTHLDLPQIDYNNLNLSDIDSWVTATDFPSPTTTITDDWLSAIPIHDPSTLEPQSSPILCDTLSPASDFDPILNYQPPSPHRFSATGMGPHQEPEEKEPEPKPAKVILPLQEAIDLTTTCHYHESYACMSLDMHKGAPRTIDERWREFETSAADEVYCLISYIQWFEGYESLTYWQWDFLMENKHLSPPICYFCNLPEHYWCGKVVAIQYKD